MRGKIVALEMVVTIALASGKPVFGMLRTIPKTRLACGGLELHWELAA